MKYPLVIAHRGASGYRPENTLEAFRLGILQQADGIEFDLVTTKDKALIIRHENALSSTTNVNSLPEFKDKLRLGVLDQHETKDYFSEDFNLSEIKSMKAIERRPELRPGSAKFDGIYGIPTFADLLHQDFIDGKYLVCEIKDGSHLASLDTAISELLVTVLLDSKVIDNLVIESFNLQLLLESKAALKSAGISAKYFLLLEDSKLQKVIEHLEDLDGISISLELLFSNFDWVDFAHQNGKQIWVYTARAEEADTSIEAYYEKIIQTGVDGIFADQPDLLRRVLEDRAG